MFFTTKGTKYTKKKTLLFLSLLCLRALRVLRGSLSSWWFAENLHNLHARGNEPPSAQEQAVAQRFVERVLARIPPDRLGAVQKARRELGLRVRGLLGRPDTLQEPLTPDELTKLGEAVSIAHPTEARRAGLLRFLEEQGAAVLAAMGATSER